MSIMNRITAALARAIAPHITAALPAQENEALKAEIAFLKAESERLALHSRDEEEFRGEVALIVNDHFYSKEEIIDILNEEIDLEEAIDDLELITRWEAEEKTEEAISEWARDELRDCISEEGFLREEDVREIIAERAEEIRAEISAQLKEEIKAEGDLCFDLCFELIGDLRAEIEALKAEIKKPWWTRLF